LDSCPWFVAWDKKRKPIWISRSVNLSIEVFTIQIVTVDGFSVFYPKLDRAH